MSADQDIEAFSEIVERNGRAIMEKAISSVLGSNYDAGKASQAAKHHTAFLSRVAPVFPALVNLSYEAAGKGTYKPTGAGAALTMFVEAANIHDDIIDQTAVKHKRKTAYGKYGADTSILAGDLLLVKASLTLYKECEVLLDQKRDQVVELTFGSLVEISKSAAQEALMHRKLDVTPKSYLEVVRLRAAVPEVHCKIGAIFGGATEEIVYVLGCYGRTYGVVGTVLDEFMDLLDFDKFNARLSKECLPLPLMSALQDKTLQTNILPKISGFSVSKADHAQTVQLVMASNRVKKLKEDTVAAADKTIQEIQGLIENNAGKDLSKLLKILRGLICNTK
jgi:geranylgeranyl pyrophosphate synthase